MAFTLKKWELNKISLAPTDRILYILEGLNNDLKVMIFNGCMHSIAEENPSALYNQARG